MRVLGIRSVSLSTVHPQCKLSDASHMRYIEYALELPLSLPSPRLSTHASTGPATGYGAHRDRSYRVSNVHAQHGIDRYPLAAQSVASRGTHGVSSSAWFPMRNTPGFRCGWDASGWASAVGSRASTRRASCVACG